jgi:hypothetical protein
MALSGFASAQHPVTAVPEEIRTQFKLNAFYKKCINLGGFPIVSSERVPDAALREAAYLIDKMLGGRPDILQAMAKNGVRFSVMADDEFTTDIPEHAHLKPKIYWDKRARGLGATPSAPSVSCGEENLLLYQGDKYFLENILIHEFAHAIHEMGMNTVDPKFDRDLELTFDEAIAAGKWKGTYAATNHREYFAEAVQSWFHCNRVNDHQHNHINSRKQLTEYDPKVAKMVQRVFGDNAWTYKRVDTRKTDLEHLEGFDRKSAPRFTWPPRLKDFDAYKWEREKAEREKAEDKSKE